MGLLQVAERGEAWVSEDPRVRTQGYDTLPIVSIVLPFLGGYLFRILDLKMG